MSIGRDDVNAYTPSGSGSSPGGSPYFASNVAADTDFVAFLAMFTGTATLLLSLATASVVNLMVTVPSGIETSLGPINSGAPIPAGQPDAYQFPISEGATYAFQLGTTQVGNMFSQLTAVPR